MKTGTAPRSKGEIKILHAVAGRVRLGFVDSRTKEVITNTVEKKLRQQEEIKEIRINESLNNMLILFDANKLSMLTAIFYSSRIWRYSNTRSGIGNQSRDFSLRCLFSSW
ncbi:hypothetical protein IQ238_12045 [Pleurocapsales cyanobacterium LEGE 06147]|nr:hypothetical protein [Pleurocapsales cyanobacterium LEGE 06147]